jgi:hypothetical protein
MKTANTRISGRKAFFSAEGYRITSSLVALARHAKHLPLNNSSQPTAPALTLGGHRPDQTDQRKIKNLLQ